MEIVGVVGDALYESLRDAPPPTVYVPWAQMSFAGVIGRLTQEADRVQRVDGRRDIEHIEVLTPHYRGAHAAAKARSGFTGYQGGGARVGSRVGHSGRGGRPFDPDLADEFLR